VTEHDDRTRSRTRDAVLSGRDVAGPRSEIAASWRRVAASGVDPGGGPSIAPLSEGELERRRTTSGLGALLPQLNASLQSVVDAGQLVVVTDSEGRVLWRLGSASARRLADGLGFVTGSAWTEGNVGTNAIGTCLVTGSPVQIRGAEHFVESHTYWGCAAAPLHDPWTGRAIGVVDVSGPTRTLHPAELGLVTTAARLAALEVLEGHRASLDRLRAHATPVVARLSGQVLVVDRSGHLALASGLSAPGRIMLPAAMAVGAVWLPGVGGAIAEALPGGWLLRLAGEDAGTASLELDLTDSPVARLTGPSGTWTHDLTPRHAEILVALLRAGPSGRTAAALADDLFADTGREVTVRAEVSRLRRTLGAVVLSQPYRISPSITARLVLPDDPATVLPGSSAPTVVALRRASAGGAGT
jgi:hypothetical protein